MVITDLRVEELDGCAQMGCMAKKLVFLLASPLSAAVGKHDKTYNQSTSFP